MEPKKLKKKKGPEAIIQEDLIKYLKVRDWYVMVTHGNMYQSGFPDLYATHSQYGPRWIEVKNAAGRWEFTPAQMECFPKLMAHGTRIWILSAATKEEYDKLFKPDNAFHYFMAKL